MGGHFASAADRKERHSRKRRRVWKKLMTRWVNRNHPDLRSIILGEYALNTESEN